MPTKNAPVPSADYEVEGTAPAAAPATPEAPDDATFEDLLGKSARTKVIPVNVGGQDGPGRIVHVTIRAIGGTEWDRIISENPPTDEQRGQGMRLDPSRFNPAIIAATFVQPRLTVAQATRLYTSEAWSSGEIDTVLGAITALNLQGADVPFTAAG